MQGTTQAEFKTLLTKQEYDRLMEEFKGSRIDYQTNHYFDTSTFSLKACDASLRVRERDNLVLIYRKKKSYNTDEKTNEISREEFEEIKNTGRLIPCDVANEVSQIIGTRKVINFMSLSTKRLCFPYKGGVLFVDESTYLNVTDYELEYEAKTYDNGKKEFVQLLCQLGVKYKKADKKIQRAYNALKNMDVDD